MTSPITALIRQRAGANGRNPSRAYKTAGVLLFFTLPITVAAQPARETPPLFAALPTDVDFSNYPSVEDCLGAVTRLRAAASPEAVVEGARRCGAPFTNVDSASKLDLPLLQELFLHAEQGNLAWDVLGRRLTLLPGDSTRVRLTLLQEAWRFALGLGRPAHVGWAEHLVAETGRLGWDWRFDRLAGYAEMLSYAARERPYNRSTDAPAAAMDTTLGDRYANAILRLFDSLPAADREVRLRTWHSILSHRYASAALNYQHLRALARGETDPLEPSNVWWIRAGAPRLRGEPVDSVALAEAKANATRAAPALKADVWFNRPDSNTPRPTRGRLSLVIFADQPSNEQLLKCGLPCTLYERFGEALADALEITVVTHTHGNFRNYPPFGPNESELWNAPPLATDSEVELIRKYFYEHLGLPNTVALGIEVTKFTHLPPPDARREDQPPANVLAYSPSRLLARRGGKLQLQFGLGERDHRGEGGDVFLIDPDGKIVMRHFPLEAVISGWLARSPIKPSRTAH